MSEGHLYRRRRRCARLVLSPVLRSAAVGRRTAEARLEEAVGLARAIDLDVVHGEVVRLSQLPARRRCSARARSSGSRR